MANAVGVERRHLAKTAVYVKDLRPDHLDELYAGVNVFVEEGGTFVELTASTLVGVAALHEPWCVVEIGAVAVVD